MHEVVRRMFPQRCLLLFPRNCEYFCLKWQRGLSDMNKIFNTDTLCLDVMCASEFLQELNPQSHVLVTLRG